MPYYSILQTSIWFSLIAALYLLVRFLHKGYVWRRRAAKLPGPPHHPIWGHFLVMAEAARASPRGAAGQTLALMVKHRYNMPDLFYIDLWPLAPSLLLSTHPMYSNQFTVQTSMPKHPGTFSGDSIFALVC